MDLNTWLDQETGRASALADHFGIDRSAVTHWRTYGPPVRRFADIVALTRGAVTLPELLSKKMEAQASA